MKFNKFHGLFCTLRRFIHKYQMAGRVLEESNEAYNGTLWFVKGYLKSMPNTKQRVHTTTSREQGNTKGPIPEARLHVQKVSTGNKRGPQQAKARAVEGGDIMGDERVFAELDGERYVKLPNGNLLLECWIDIYEWFEGGKAPNEWIVRLNKSAPT